MVATVYIDGREDRVSAPPEAKGDDLDWVPQFCHGCGHPYPWMADRLQTARELLYHDDKLTMEDRTRLFEDLQYVMSDPKAGLAPAKTKLIEIRLGKATAYVREIILDLVAKTAAEGRKS